MLARAANAAAARPPRTLGLQRRAVRARGPRLRGRGAPRALLSTGASAGAQLSQTAAAAAADRRPNLACWQLVAPQRVVPFPRSFFQRTPLLAWDCGPPPPLTAVHAAEPLIIWLRLHQHDSAANPAAAIAQQQHTSCACTCSRAAVHRSKRTAKFHKRYRPRRPRPELVPAIVWLGWVDLGRRAVQAAAAGRYFRCVTQCV